MKKICNYFIALSIILTFSIQNFILGQEDQTTNKCVGCERNGSPEVFGSCGLCGSGWQWCSSRPMCDCYTPRSGPCPCSRCTCVCDSCGEQTGACTACCQATACGYPFFAYRSTSINAARDITGISRFIHKDGMDKTSGAFSVAAEYTRSFRPNHINQFLFGSDLCCNTLAIQGSNILGAGKRMCCAWLADYFGLSPAFDSRVSFCPRIENVIVNFDLFLGLDGATEGLYFRIHSPLTWTRWNLNMCENVINPGIKNGNPVGFAPTYMAAEPTNPNPPNYHGEIPQSALPKSFVEAISGCATWGDMKTPMCFGRMTCCRQTLTRLADIHAVLGWNFVLDTDYHFGANLRAVFPTGNKPCPNYLFSPQIGDQKHWQLGGGITSSWIIWRNEDNFDNYVGLYFDANLLHLLTNCQCRSFDFCGKPNSRYMLLAQMGVNVNDNLIYTDPTITSAANYQYKRNLIPAINYTTFNVNVVIDVQADLVFKLGIVKNNWSFDIGYNFWGRTGERFFSDNCCCCQGCNDDTKYAIKGDAILYGSPYDHNLNIYTAPIPLSSSQKNADIHAGQNIKLGANGAFDIANAQRNKGVDNPKLASHITPTTVDNLHSEAATWPNQGALIPSQIYTSIQPELISCDDINLCKSPSAISHKCFVHLDYAGNQRENRWNTWTPFFGLGAEVEVDNSNATRFAVAQWGVWIKGGVAFE